ncbi:MAG: hypothetical protein HY720_32185 [Planctomycetes bacterium]|nr:hypothetical protein [Planctomycetota bacterium]
MRDSLRYPDEVFQGEPDGEIRAYCPQPAEGRSAFWLASRRAAAGSELATSVHGYKLLRGKKGDTFWIERVRERARLEGATGSRESERAFVYRLADGALIMAPIDKEVESGDFDSLSWRMLLAEPVEAGHSWSPLPGNADAVARVAAIEALDLPLARLESCARVVVSLLPSGERAGQDEGLRVSETWYAPGIGLVAERYWSPAGACVSYAFLMATREPTAEEIDRCVGYLAEHPEGPPG